MAGCGGRACAVRCKLRLESLISIEYMQRVGGLGPLFQPLFSRGGAGAHVRPHKAARAPQRAPPMSVACMSVVQPRSSSLDVRSRGAPSLGLGRSTRTRRSVKPDGGESRLLFLGCGRPLGRAPSYVRQFVACQSGDPPHIDCPSAAAPALRPEWRDAGNPIRDVDSRSAPPSFTPILPH